MSEKYYTKETGWTEAGIVEQERRSDLTELKPCELVAHLDGREHAEMCGTCDYSKETERRLERLEQCEQIIASCERCKGLLEK